jgi:hypothetical protein
MMITQLIYEELLSTINEMVKVLVKDCIEDYEKRVDNISLVLMGKKPEYCKHVDIIERVTGLDIKEVIRIYNED